MWFVEDEITTGRTILNLVLRLCSLLKVKYVRLFALADTRPAAQVTQFNSILTSYNINYSIHTLIEAEIQTLTESQNCLLNEEKAEISIPKNKNAHDWHFYDQRSALKAQFNTIQELPKSLTGTLLVIGEAIDIGIKLVQNNPSLLFQHI